MSGPVRSPVKRKSSKAPSKRARSYRANAAAAGRAARRDGTAHRGVNNARTVAAAVRKRGRRSLRIRSGLRRLSAGG